MQTIINKWREFNPHEYLLTTKAGGHISSPRLNKILHDFFERPLSSSLLRHIIITHRGKSGELKTVKQRKELAKDMGHSVEQQMMEYEK